jgi:hypothetical protein
MSQNEMVSACQGQIWSQAQTTSNCRLGAVGAAGPVRPGHRPFAYQRRPLSYSRWAWPAMLVPAGLCLTACNQGFAVTDVSPDNERRTTLNANTGGRIITVVVDPHRENFVYADSEFAGVWRSEDGGTSWTQASRGLRNGRSAGVPALAADETRSGWLLYSTQDDDDRPAAKNGRHHYGGLWYSDNYGDTWQKVNLSNSCLNPNVRAVDFSAGHALVVTQNCGLITSTDMLTWSSLPALPDGSSPAVIAVRGQDVAACNGRPISGGRGSVIYKSTIPDLLDPSGTPAGMPWGLTASSGLETATPCKALAMVPTRDSRRLAAVALGVDPGSCAPDPWCTIDISLVDFGTGTVLSFGFERRLQTLFPDDSVAAGKTRCCGRARVFVAPHGSGFDVFASDGRWFYQLQSQLILVDQVTITTRLPSDWQSLSVTGESRLMHDDAWSMAFPRTYDSSAGRCAAFSSHDGGVSKRTSCDTHSWVPSMSGLHAFKSGIMAGVGQNPCTHSNCITLYVPSGDNATWVSANGVNPGTPWDWINCCGDTGFAIADPALKRQVLTGEEGQYHVIRAPRDVPPTQDDPSFDIHTGPDGIVGFPSSESQQAPISQVLTMDGEPGWPLGDYVALQRPSNAPGDDVIVRSRISEDRLPNWQPLYASSPIPGQSSSGNFSRNSVLALATSGGHTHLVVYVLISAPSVGAGPQRNVFRGQVNGSGVVPRWENISDGCIQSNGTSVSVTHAANLFADPYDPTVLYVTDIDAGDIKSSFMDGSGRFCWRTEPELTRLATNNGEFLFACKGSLAFGDRLCPLQFMIFSREARRIRVAVLFPGGLAFSRNAGANWTSISAVRGIGALRGITSLRDLIAQPYSGFYDSRPNPITGYNALYLALLGRGVVRIEGPFN